MGSRLHTQVIQQHQRFCIDHPPDLMDEINSSLDGTAPSQWRQLLWARDQESIVHIASLKLNCCLLQCSGDTRPTQTLTDLAKLHGGTDVLLLQNMGPILDFQALPYTSQYLLNVRLHLLMLSLSCSPWTSLPAHWFLGFLIGMHATCCWLTSISYPDGNAGNAAIDFDGPSPHHCNLSQAACSDEPTLPLM